MTALNLHRQSYARIQQQQNKKRVSTLFVFEAVWRQRSGQTLHKGGPTRLPWFQQLESVCCSRLICVTLPYSLLIINCYNGAHTPVLHKLSARLLDVTIEWSLWLQSTISETSQAQERFGPFFTPDWVPLANFRNRATVN